MIKSFNIRYRHRSDLVNARDRCQHHPVQKTLIQVFSGQVSKTQVEQIYRDVIEIFPGAPLLGTTTAGEITDGQVLDRSVVINLTLFETTTVCTYCVDQYDDLHQAGETFAQLLEETNPQVIILFGCSMYQGRKIDASPLLTTLQTAFPQSLIAGGQAGDNGNGVISYVFNESGIIEHGAIAATLSGEHLSAHNSYNLSWVPIGKKFTITKAVGSRVFSIDERSPLELYEHYLGADVVEGLPLSAADFPFILEREGVPMAIHALGVNDDGSFDYIHHFQPGEQVQFGFCHSGLLVQSVEKTISELRTHPIQVAFIYSCVTRKWILGQDIRVEISPIAELAATAGFFAYGEYFAHPTGQCYLFSQTMTVLTLAEEEDGPAVIATIPHTEEISKVASKQLKTLQVLHHLVETSAKEIEIANQKLAEIAHRDGLTSLFNRRYFDLQFELEFSRAQRSKEPLSLLLIDIDDFKAFNDTYGHVQGDTCLRGVAAVLQDIPQRPADFVARYGGEEFILVLPNTPFAGAMTVAHKIRQRINGLAIPHQASRVQEYVTVSLGVITVQSMMKQMTQASIVAQCDQQLYLAKYKGRNQVCGMQV